MARLTVRVAGLAGAGVLAATVGTGATPSSAAGHNSARHVLLLSIDGLHQTDLAVRATHPPRRSRAGGARHRVHPRPDTGRLGLLSRPDRPDDGRQPIEHGRLLRRQLEPRAAARPGPRTARAPRRASR